MQQRVSESSESNTSSTTSSSSPDPTINNNFVSSNSTSNNLNMQLDHYQDDLPDHNDHPDHVSDQASDDNPKWRGILRKSDSKINLND